MLVTITSANTPMLVTTYIYKHTNANDDYVCKHTNGGDDICPANTPMPVTTYICKHANAGDDLQTSYKHTNAYNDLHLKHTNACNDLHLQTHQCLLY